MRFIKVKIKYYNYELIVIVYKQFFFENEYTE